MSSSALRTRVSGRWQHCRQLLRRLRSKPSPLRYWEKRAERYGARSVVHIGHPEGELAAVTEKQKQMLHHQPQQIQTQQYKQSNLY